MIELKDVFFEYEEGNHNVNSLNNISLRISKGECVVLCGESGCGKTTLTRLINGLAPHFYRGRVQGKVIIQGEDISNQAIAVTSESVGSVFQNPRTQFFNVDTTSEVVFGCENRGMLREDMIDRLKEVTSLFSLETLLDRSIFHLSGGEKQRIACASVYATQPDIFVLDEPSSSLDVKAIAQLRDVIHTLKRLGKTVIISEHRLYYLKDVADQFVVMTKGQVQRVFSKESFSALPHQYFESNGLRAFNLGNLSVTPNFFKRESEALRLKNVHLKRQHHVVLDIPELIFYQGEVVAIIGHNGAGKTTLAHCLCGLLKSKGTFQKKGRVLKASELIGESFMVMQDVNAQLFAESVEEEVTLHPEDNSGNDVQCILDTLKLAELRERHPLSLSGGEKQRLALATAMFAGKRHLIYDEPTSGLDLESMKRMGVLIKKMQHHVDMTLIITHDVELILSTCQRVIHMEKGRIIDDFILDAKGFLKIKDYFSTEAFSHELP